MLTTPQIVEKRAQAFAAASRVVRLDELSVAVDQALGAVFGWLDGRDAAPAGPPFFRYRVIDMPNRMEIDFGVPTDRVLPANEGVITGKLPAGRYASAMHTGPYDGLVAATFDLLRWIVDNGLELDTRKTALGDSYACRLEIYHTDPRAEPDRARLQTELAIRLAD